MKKFLALSFIVVVFAEASAQVTNCAQTLRLARSTYDQGRLHELPGLLEHCLKDGFTDDQKVEAYKLLAEAYLYLEEPEKADEAMLNLLRTNHYFQINENVDPAEFVGLYNTFRTKPVYNIGIKGGINGTFPMLMKNYYVGEGAKGNGKYGTTVAFQAGVVFEKNFFDRSKSKILKRITFAPELFYTIRSFAYSNPDIFPADINPDSSVASQTGSIKQNWIDVNAIIQYKLGESNLNPYVGFGPGISWLIGAQNQYVFTRDGGVGTVSGAAINVPKIYEKLVPSLVAIAGIKYQFGAIKLIVEGRLQYGLINVTNPDSRSNPASVFNNVWTPNNYRQVNATANIGFVYPYFNPIKKSHKKIKAVK